MLDVERTWVMVLLNTKDGTKIMKGPFSILHNRDAEKSNAHQPKKNLSNHFPKKINNPFTLVKILYTGISVREIPKNFGHFWLAYFFETDRNSLACLSNHFVKSK